MRSVPKPVPLERSEQLAAKYGKAWGKAWGEIFRLLMKQNHKSLRKIAEDVGIEESTARSYTNGIRDPQLRDFFRMCDAAGIAPELVLFPATDGDNFLEVVHAWNTATKEGRDHILVAAKGAREHYGSKNKR